MSASQSTAAEKPAHLWKPGQSGNPGGQPKALRQLQQTLTLAHGPQVTLALQKLFELGMGEAESEKVQVQALDAFVSHTSRLTGLQALAARAGDKTDEPTDAEGLEERVAEALVKRNPELVREKLAVVSGGKAP